MKIKYFLTFLMVVYFFASLSAYSKEKSSNVPIGAWEVKQTDTSGDILIVKTLISKDKTFSGIVLRNGAATATFGGNWSITGNEITYSYTDSSIPLPENYKDTDIIISVSESLFRYKSKSSGQVTTSISYK